MKKAISLILTAAMVATALTACGGTSSSSNATKETSETGAVAASGETFKIGSMGPITGGAALYGTAVRNGAQIAVDEINENGGINGYQIEFKFQDDEHDAEKAVNGYNALKDWGVQAVVGATTSTPTVAIATETANDRIFQITPSGTAVDCVANDNAFRVCFSDPTQGTKSAQYIAQNGLPTKVAVIYDSSDTYSSGIYETFVKEAPEQNIEVVSATSFTADNKTDFSVQVQDAKDNGAELVFLPIYYTEASLILTQADKIGYTPVFFGCDGLDGLTGVENFDLALAEGVMLLTPFAADADDEATQSFVKKYKDAYGDTPIQFAADAYDAVYAIKLAAEKENLTPSMSTEEICDGLIAGMQEIELVGLTGTITWSASGEPEKEPKAVVIENGVYKSME